MSRRNPAISAAFLAAVLLVPPAPRVPVSVSAQSAPDGGTGTPSAASSRLTDGLVAEYLSLARSDRARWVRQRCGDRLGDRCEREMGRLGAEYLDLHARVQMLAESILADEPAAMDVEFLRWRTDEGVAAYLEPETTRYERLLLRHTSERLSPEQLHEIGLDEVARLRGAMQEWVDGIASARQDVQPGMELRGFLDAARKDPRLYASSRAELLESATAISRRTQARLEQIFSVLPRAPLRIVTPREMEGGVMARYAGSAGRAGIVALNPDPRQVPLFVLEALMLHEGLPGHHLQIALATEQAQRPDWWGDHEPTAYVEGWGLYAESLGHELDLYRHPFSDFGRLTLEMWRALRLVIDTGLHAYDWDQARAVEMFLDNTPLPVRQARIEVERYRENPGQAVAYKVGELRLQGLRARAEQAMGEDFELAAFHELVLRHGPVPLRALDRQVDAWIAAALQN